jgi:hypothetical protein
MFYRIDTNLTKEQSEKIVDSLTPIEVERLDSYKLKAYDMEVNGKLSSFIITSRSIFTRLVLFLRQKEIEFQYEEITDDVLNGDIHFKGTLFESDVEDFIKENLTVDHVLDKINKFGIESLTEFDRNILESH